MCEIEDVQTPTSGIQYGGDWRTMVLLRVGLVLIFWGRAHGEGMKHAAIGKRWADHLANLERDMHDVDAEAVAAAKAWTRTLAVVTEWVGRFCAPSGHRREPIGHADSW